MREVINLNVVFTVISRNLIIIGISLLACAGVALYFSEDTKPFIYSSTISLIIGLTSFFLTKNKKQDISITRKDAYFTVTVSWIVIFFAGCLPYVFSGAIPHFIDALFESVSGFTTTGASILVDIEVLPKSILFWRSLTHWIGGIGIIVLVIIIMPSLKIGGYHLFTLESSLQEKIQPRIKSVGNRLLIIYVGLTLLEIALLMLGKMNLFESACHAFGTVATGGFSPKNTSIAGYSPYIQYVIMLFMFLAGTNFIVHYYLIKRDFKKVSDNEELKFYILVTVILGLILTASLFIFMHKDLEESFREAFFQIISIITCTGFASADYLLWPQFAWMIIFFAMFLGGSTGSTAGGIKMARHLILFKNIRRNIRQLLSRNVLFQIRLNKRQLTEETNNSVLTFITVYLLFFVLGSFLLILLGIDSKTASSSIATCMAGIGPGIGTVGPVSNFAHLPDMAKILLSFFMLLGRLEIYTIIVLFYKSFWTR